MARQSQSKYIFHMHINARPGQQLPTTARHSELLSVAVAGRGFVAYAKFEIFLVSVWQEKRVEKLEIQLNALGIFTYFPIHSIHHPLCRHLDAFLPFAVRIDPHPSVQLISEILSSPPRSRATLLHKQSVAVFYPAPVYRDWH